MAAVPTLLNTGADSPAWLSQLSRGLDGNERRVCEPVLARLRRSGRIDESRLVRAAVLAAILRRDQGPALLLTRRRETLSQHAGQVALPGGAEEATDQGPEQTALREAEEEVGLAPGSVRILGRLPRYPTVTGYLVTPVVGYVQSPPAFVAQPTEVADIFTVPLSVLLDPRQWQDRPIEFAGERFPNRELHWEGRRVWGATAGMLQQLLEPLRDALGAGQ